MPYKPSRCVCLQVPDPQRAMSFYRDRLGLQEAASRDSAAGCEVVRWEGRGGCCYLRDPFGLAFNLFEDPGAFA